MPGRISKNGIYGKSKVWFLALIYAFFAFWCLFNQVLKLFIPFKSLVHIKLFMYIIEVRDFNKIEGLRMASAPITPRGDEPIDLENAKTPKVHRVKGVPKPDLTTSLKSDTVYHHALGDGTITLSRAREQKVVKVVRSVAAGRPANDPQSQTIDALRAFSTKEGGDPIVLSVYETSSGVQHLVTKSINPTTIVGKVLGKMRGGLRELPESDKPEKILDVVVKACNELSNDPHTTLEEAQTLVTFCDFITQWSESGSKLDPKVKQQMLGLQAGLKKELKSAVLPGAINTARAHIEYASMDLDTLQMIFKGDKDPGRDIKSFKQMSSPEKIGFLKVFFDKLGSAAALAFVIEQTNTYSTGNKETAFRGNDDYSVIIKAFLSLHLQHDFQESKGFQDLLKIAEAAATMKEQQKKNLKPEEIARMEDNDRKTGTVKARLVNQAWDGVVRDLQEVCSKNPDVEKFLKAVYDKCEASGLNPQQMVTNIVFLRLINPLINTERSKPGVVGSEQLLELSRAFQNAVNLTADKGKGKVDYTAQFVEDHKAQVLKLGRTLAGLDQEG